VRQAGRQHDILDHALAPDQIDGALLRHPAVELDGDRVVAGGQRELRRRRVPA
jgi:hypothetical protein